jgi:hypothetical protein
MLSCSCCMSYTSPVSTSSVTPVTEHRYNPKSRTTLSARSEQNAHATSAYASPLRPVAQGGRTWNRKLSVFPSASATSNCDISIVLSMPKTGVTWTRNAERQPTLTACRNSRADIDGLLAIWGPSAANSMLGNGFRSSFR